VVSDRIPKDFLTAIQITDIHSISNVFYGLKAKEVLLQLRYSGYIYRAKVIDLLGNQLQLDVPDFQLTHERRCTAHFESDNRFYFCLLQLDRSNKSGVYIVMPGELRFLARRKYRRIKFDDLFMRFTIMFSPNLATKSSDVNIETRHSFFVQEVIEDDPSLAILYQMLMADITPISRDYTFLNYQELKQEQLTLQDQVLLNSGKGVLVDNTASTESYFQDLESSSLTSMEPYYEELLIRMSEKDAVKEIEKIKKEDLKRFLVSYLLLPIQLFGKTIGALRIETNQFEKRSITLTMAADLAAVMELFSYALTKIRIHDSHYKINSPKTRIHNISLSGLLMELDDEIVYQYLQKHRRIKMLIDIEGKEVEVFGEIVRYFEMDGSYFMGVMFFKSRPGDLITLERFIFENFRFSFI
jgi:c-di-GMP-binding flagellar brake protein YcgR